MRLALHINMDNEAFSESWGHEAARILRALAAKIEDRARAPRGWDGGKLMDLNGNSVGQWEVEAE